MNLRNMQKVPQDGFEKDVQKKGTSFYSMMIIKIKATNN